MKFFAAAAVVGLAAASTASPVVLDFVCECCKEGCAVADVTTVTKFADCTKDISCEATAKVRAGLGPAPCVAEKVVGAEVDTIHFDILHLMNVDVKAAVLVVNGVTAFTTGDCDDAKWVQDVFATVPATCASADPPTAAVNGPFVHDPNLKTLTADLTSLPVADKREIRLGMTEATGKTGCKLVTAVPADVRATVVFDVKKAAPTDPGSDGAGSMLALGAASVAAISAFLL